MNSPFMTPGYIHLHTCAHAAETLQQVFVIPFDCCNPPVLSCSTEAVTVFIIQCYNQLMGQLVPLCVFETNTYKTSASDVNPT